MVNEGRIMVGNPMESCCCSASSMLWAITAAGTSMPISSMASRNCSRSSAMSIASREAPIISTPNFSSTPSRTRSRAQFSAVCPPMVGNNASGLSLAMICATVRHSIGSMYIASAVSGSVMIVAGFELTRMTR